MIGSIFFTAFGILSPTAFSKAYKREGGRGSDIRVSTESEVENSKSHMFWIELINLFKGTNIQQTGNIQQYSYIGINTSTNVDEK